MRLALALVVPLAAALLQASVVPFVSVGGARPNMPLLVAASWSLAAAPREAVWWAFWGGLVVDLLSGGPLGAMALASLAPVAAIGLGERQVARPRSVLTAMLLVGAATAAASLIYLAILLATGQPLADFPAVAGAAVSGGVYNGVLTLAAYPLARLLQRTTENQASLGW